MPIYFLQCQVTNLIRIGQSRTAESLIKRVAGHAAQSPTHLTLLGIIPDLHQDCIIHAQFEHLFHHGEWFNPSQDLMAFIKEQVVPFDLVLGNRCQAVILKGTRCKSIAITSNGYCKMHQEKNAYSANCIQRKIAQELKAGDMVILDHQRTAKITHLKEAPKSIIAQIRFRGTERENRYLFNKTSMVSVLK